MKRRLTREQQKAMFAKIHKGYQVKATAKVMPELGSMAPKMVIAGRWKMPTVSKRPFYALLISRRTFSRDAMGFSRQRFRSVEGMKKAFAELVTPGAYKINVEKSLELLGKGRKR